MQKEIIKDVANWLLLNLKLWARSEITDKEFAFEVKQQIEILRTQT